VDSVEGPCRNQIATASGQNGSGWKYVLGVIVRSQTSMGFVGVEIYLSDSIHCGLAISMEDYMKRYINITRRIFTYSAPYVNGPHNRSSEEYEDGSLRLLRSIFTAGNAPGAPVSVIY
jgi:hypothetical protein